MRIASPPLDAYEMLPAAVKAIGVEDPAQRRALVRYIAAIDHKATARCVTAERAVLAALGRSCHTSAAARRASDVAAALEAIGRNTNIYRRRWL